MKRHPFWEMFVAAAPEIATTFNRGESRAAFDRVHVLLAKAGLDVITELTADDESNVLVFSAEGDPAKARQIDDLWAQRPEVPGWKVFPRRQRRHLNDAAVIAKNIYDIDPRDGRYRAELVGSRWEVAMYHADFSDTSGENPQNGVLAMLLEHAVGEAFVEANVASCRGFPDSMMPGETLPLEELAALLRRAADSQ